MIAVRHTAICNKSLHLLSLFSGKCCPIEIPSKGVFMRRNRIARRAFMLVLAALLLSTSAFAAEVTASLLGTVRDASGAVVAGASLSLTNIQTNVTKKADSGSDGEYSFTLIPVGQYRLTVERSRFRKY